MGDDPYDFEIALPASTTAAARSTRKHLSSNGSDGDASEDSGSISNMSGISSDNDSDRGSDPEQTETTIRKVTKNANELRNVAPSSGSALDRAKSFLTKYSSAASADLGGSKAATSSRNRRVSLDFDGDNFSFSSGDDDESSGSISAAPIKLSTARKRDGDQLQHQQSFALDSGVYDEDAFEEGISTVVGHQIVKAASADAIIPRSRKLDYSMEFSEDEAGVHLTPHPDLGQPGVPSSADSSEIEDEVGSSLGSTMEDEKNANDSNPAAITNSVVTALKHASNAPLIQLSIASESGVYDEDAFEEEESIPTPNTCPTIVKPQPIMKPEATFDYSIEFSADEPEQVDVATSQSDQVQLNRSAASRSRSGESDNGGADEDRSAFLESDSFERVGHRNVKNATADLGQYEVEKHATPDCTTFSGMELTAEESTPCQEGMPPVVARPSGIVVADLQEERTPTQAPHEYSSALEYADYTSHLLQTAIERDRPRVIIVRDFEPTGREEKRVEMKDASTQFTGNHAAIQTDLVPDGMHNLFVPAPSAPVATSSRSFGGESEVPPPCDFKSVPSGSSQQQQPPPLPLESSMYSLDALRLPIVTSTSMYKQKLLVLQEQIFQKKCETERIVHDRMAFQYSTLRGTERFIAARRAQKMELWEALMRVDPTLNELKAREVARLAQVSST